VNHRTRAAGELDRLGEGEPPARPTASRLEPSAACAGSPRCSTSRPDLLEEEP